jgi:hypothetical protein
VARLGGWSRGGAARVGRAGAVPRPPRLSREEMRARNDRFLRLDRRERRAIMRAVNRGRAAEDRRHAPLAVAVAQRQQRFWRAAWLLGPTIALAQAGLTGLPPEEVVLLAGWGTLVLGAMAWWWWSRARRAELANLAAASGRRDAGAVGTAGRLPGGSGRTTRDGGPTGAEDGGAAGDGVAPRAPRPRGRKRRGAR